jgi:hypothetical protein
MFQLQILSNGLIIPDKYLLLSPQQINNISNHCGAGSIGSKVIPNSILGIEIGNICSIHDYMYANGEGLEDKHLADNIFHKNLMTTIENENNDGVIINLFRKSVAYIYALIPKIFGGLFY